MKKQLFGVLLFSLLTIGCTGSSSSISSSGGKKSAAVNAEREKTNTPATEQKTNDARKSDLQNQIEQIAKSSKGRVGVAASLLETGESVSLNAKDRFPMQSVYKLPIGMALLNQVDAGKIKLDQKVRLEKDDLLKGSRALNPEKFPNGGEFSVRELLRLMVSESDNTASDALLKLAGGAEAVMSYLGGLGIKEIIVADTEREFARNNQAQYRNWAAPEAAVDLLRALHERRGLSEQSREMLLQFMIESPTGAKRLKGQLPAGAVVAHKTGTSGTAGGITAATNDIGIITLPDGRHLAVAVFVSDSTADEATREEVIAGIARAAWDFWSKK